MLEYRIYGNPPINNAILHGGPGAPGEVAPLAREIASVGGVLEPFQSKSSIKGQLEELQEMIREHTAPPITLIGWSWGAMLGFIFTASYPQLVRKLILLSSGVFEEHYAKEIMTARLNRLSIEQKRRITTLMKELDDPASEDKSQLFSEFGKIISKADNFDAIQEENNEMSCQYEIYKKVWPEAAALRKSGELLKLGEKIQCPVTAIHGDYDPHPSEGIKTPLKKVLKDFTFIEIKKCGHYPWKEKQAKEEFLRILYDELET